MNADLSEPDENGKKRRFSDRLTAIGGSFKFPMNKSSTPLAHEPAGNAGKPGRVVPEGGTEAAKEEEASPEANRSSAAPPSPPASPPAAELAGLGLAGLAEGERAQASALLTIEESVKAISAQLAFFKSAAEKKAS